MIRKVLLTLTLCSFFFGVRAESVDLVAYASSFDSIPIGIVKFRAQAGTSELTENRPWHILAEDLEFSGRFLVTKIMEADSARFAAAGVGIYIDGEYQVTGNTVTLDCYLRDAKTNEMIVGKKYKSKVQYIRGMAHRYANQVMDMLLSESGYFESKILFVRENGAAKNLCIMDYDGYGIHQLTQSATVNIFPAFIDSNSVIWTAYYRGKPDLYRGSTSSGAFKIFVYSRFVETSPAFSSVTGRISYASSKTGNLDIYTCDLDGGDQKQITFHRAIDTSPCWSPNGYQIAFTSDRSGQPQIYVMDADGVNTKRLTFNGRYQDSPAWSPDGDLIAYSSLQNGKFDIWSIKPDGSEPKQVTTSVGHNEYPTWSPDGSHIAFVSTRGGKSDIYVVRPDGSGEKRVTTVGNARMPDWSHN